MIGQFPFVRRLQRGKPLDKLRARALRGDAEAQYRLGQAYLLGDGVLETPRTAVNWLELAARQNHARAQHSLSLIYLSGATARGSVTQWMAQAGATEAARANAALLFPDGISVDVAHDRAFAYATAAADAGLAAAQANLGMLHLRGIGCAQDFAAAELWCSRAAAQGDTGGALGLGIIHEHGFGREPDLAGAARWYGIAADGGNDAAATALGLLYLDGRGVELNPIKAERLLAGPAARGSIFARRGLASLQALRQQAIA